MRKNMEILNLPEYELIEHRTLADTKTESYLLKHRKSGARVFVIESDEFNRHFLAYHPTISVITNIELEHTECYKDIEDIINTFEIVFILWS